MPFQFHTTPLPDLLIVEPKVFPDHRGFFLELFKQSDFAPHIPYPFPQVNLSFSVQRVIRGIHFQKAPHAQGKLVTVLNGRIWDVAVDLRPESPTFTRWFSVELSSETPRLFWIPPGFGHGFQVLSTSALVLYKVTAEYHPDLDAGVRYDDPDLSIPWPLPDPILSDKDKNLPYLEEIRHALTF